MSTQLPVYLQDIYKTEMETLGLDPEQCWSGAIRDYRMHGSYRHLILRPRDVSGELVDEDTMRLAFTLGKTM